MQIAHTCAIIDAVLGGALDEVPMQTDRIFGLAVPTACPGVPAGLLDPRATWADPGAYDAQALRLAHMFRENFRAFEADVSGEVRAAGPAAR